MRYLDFARTLPRIEIGHVLDVLAQLPERSVHCVVTSPPYWGLRDYRLPPVVWGGDVGCKHKWKAGRGSARRGNRSDDVEVVGSSDGAVGRGPRATTPTWEFCQNCNAWRGHLGNEPTPAMYVAHLVECFRAVRRVLRDDGTLWLNLGDSYSGSGVNDGSVNPGISKAAQRGDVVGRRPGSGRGDGIVTSVSPRFRDQMPRAPGLKPLDLVGIPWAVAVALRADGWYLRSDVIWHNINPMPESQQGWRWERCRVKTKSGKYESDEKQGITRLGAGFNQRVRGEEGWSAERKLCPGCAKCKPTGGYVLRRGAWRPTGAHEYIFLLAKSPDYYCDGEGVRQPGNLRPDVRDKNLEGYQADFPGGVRFSPGMRQYGAVGSANLRDVWAFPTESLKDAHFAAFPRRLPEVCIKAGTSERGCCPTCGAPWARVVERKVSTPGQRPGYTRDCAVRNDGDRAGSWIDQDSKTIGWRPTCACPPHEPVPCVVLDPFAGSGTTLRVAEDLGRLWLGVDLSSEYLKIVRKRTAQRTVFGAAGRAAVERARVAIAPLTEEDLLRGWDSVKKKALPVRGRRV